ncbi:hypothetical protein P3L51_25395 [Streptomyces sp. PSRA5]
MGGDAHGAADAAVRAVVEGGAGAGRERSWWRSAALGGAGRTLLPGEEDNTEHREVRARAEQAFARVKRCENLRDSHQRDTGPHHAVPAVAHMHNLALAA